MDSDGRETKVKPAESLRVYQTSLIMKSKEAFLVYALVLLQSACSAALTVNDEEAQQSNQQNTSGKFLRGNKPSSAAMKSNRRLHGNIFSMHAPTKKTVSTTQRWYESSSTSASAKGKGSYAYTYTSKGKGHYYNYKGYPHDRNGSSKGKSSLPNSNFISPKGKGLPLGNWITKGKGVPISKGTEPPVTKGKGNAVCNSLSIAAESFQLVDASNGKRLRTIHPGEELFLSDLTRQYGTSSLAVECATRASKGVSVGSVQISDSFGGSVLDNSFPYTLTTPLQENPGFWHVICQPFCGPDGTGSLGTPSSTFFMVYIDDATPSPMMTSEPSQTPISVAPISQPTGRPSLPTTTLPTSAPIQQLTVSPVAALQPTAVPVTVPLPTVSPGLISLPTSAPILQPTVSPVATVQPTQAPVTVTLPTVSPGLIEPTTAPSNSTTTIVPTIAISPAPTAIPLSGPTQFPIDSSSVPTAVPLQGPTQSPVEGPTFQPSAFPTMITSVAPSGYPSALPSVYPSYVPSDVPTSTPQMISSVVAQASFPTTTPTAGAAASAVYGLQQNCATFDNQAFNICLDISSISGNIEPWFDLVLQAAARWERIISEDPWGPWSEKILRYLPEENIATRIPREGVDDIYVSVFEVDIDGPGGLFALAGPDLIIGADSKIVAGSIQIDPNDIEIALEKNVFLPLLLHELGHVLGVGTMWEEHGLVDGETYIGIHGVEAWQDEVGCSTGYLPLSGNHWNEDCVQNEFMTPFFRFNHPAPVSSLTMGSLEDLGYVVNRQEEDLFGLSDLGECGDACPELNRRLGEHRNETALTESKLSLEGEHAVLSAAANHFRKKSFGDESFSHDVVALLYQEGGNFHSRIVSKSQTKDLLI